MELNDEERAMLAGEAGIVARTAIEHQIKVGDFRLADARGRVRIPTITDPRGTDFEKAAMLGQADWMLELEAQGDRCLRAGRRRALEL